jgi:hypothetical protein
MGSIFLHLNEHFEDSVIALDSRTLYGRGNVWPAYLPGPNTYGAEILE